MQTKQGGYLVLFCLPKSCQIYGTRGIFFTHRNQIHGIGSWQFFAHHWTNSANIRLFSLTKLCVPDICPAVTESLSGISETPISAVSQAPQFEGMCLVLWGPKTDSSDTGCVVVSTHLLHVLQNLGVSGHERNPCLGLCMHARM